MLNGVKVLSFTHFLQGPSAVQMLADLGADVIKIESPKGAFERHWSGFDAFVNDVSVFFLLGNRNQRSLSIDLRTETGKEIIQRLVMEADILVENFRPGVMDRLGFGYETLKEINPRLIYCSCTGYGSDGPYRDRPGQDLLLQAMSGLATLNGAKDAPPTPVGTAAVDQHAAVLAAFGIVAALFNREKTGKGCKVESNLLNAALDLQIEPLTYYLNKGPLWERSNTGLGSRFHQAPYGIYKTLDGWIAISLTPIEKLAKAFHSNSLARYSEKDQMLKREEVNQIICEEIKKKTTEEWFAVFEQTDIWCAPVNGYEEIEKDPQVEWNKMIMTVEHPDAGNIRLLSHPIRFDGQVPAVRQYPPRLGEHTEQILREYGFSEAEIQKFIEDRIVAAQPGKQEINEK
ncbi:CaiB/BaiF CoA transferase family protein [Effusibacillus lacus]|uniref:CoA transferase n=1 Tax=Effusibacillus lacus TaxID=1348429 RepID=A0A292YJK4_9BACL|nr:CoA transferase [Effusibacillus lacus]TCS74752.1 crotonobetainyl-CoA:carnitine CoA-transferase CaiB-like acyl-CoA transferase [Effusibacillus lacus]GAX88564.1 CoA transferase [Effusibacillus lacus]